MASKTSTLVPKGALFLGILVEGDPPDVSATKANLTDWITSVKTANSWAIGPGTPATGFELYFNSGRDTAIIIDLATMKIVNITSLSSAFTELATLLP